MSNEIENSTSVSFRLDTIRGVFGIGTAVSFKGSYSSPSAHCASFKRLVLFYKNLNCGRCSESLVASFLVSNSIIMSSVFTLNVFFHTFCEVFSDCLSTQTKYTWCILLEIGSRDNSPSELRSRGTVSDSETRKENLGKLQNIVNE